MKRPAYAQLLSRVFRYAIATARAERDPAGDLRGALTVPKVKHLAAITTEKEAGELMRAIEGYAPLPSIAEYRSCALRAAPGTRMQKPPGSGGIEQELSS